MITHSTQYEKGAFSKHTSSVDYTRESLPKNELMKTKKGGSEFYESSHLDKRSLQNDERAPYAQAFYKPGVVARSNDPPHPKTLVFNADQPRRAH